MSTKHDLAERVFDEVAQPDTDTDGGDPELLGIAFDAARIRHGHLEESRDAWAHYRSEVARYYGAKGPVEMALVDRIVALQARLRRLQRAEGGKLMADTAGLVWRRTMRRFDEGERSLAYSKMQLEGVSRGTQAHLVRLGLRKLTDLIGWIESGDTLPPPNEFFKVLIEVFGVGDGKDGQLKGPGPVLQILYGLAARRLSFPEGEEPADPEAYALEMRGRLLDKLKESAETLRGLVQALDEDDRHRDIGVAEAKALPDKNQVQALVRYERHLEDALKRATRELERAVARRGLSAAGRRLQRR